MQKFGWDDSLSVGVKLIDEQHKVWIERLNSLSEAIEARRESHNVSKTLNFMMDYVEFHFAAEEDLMAVQHYPGIAHHKKEHQKFRDILMDLLVLEIEEEDATTTIASSIYNFQISWLKEHIQQTDKQFAAFLKGKNAALCSNSDLSCLELQPALTGAGAGPEGAAAPDSADFVLPRNPAW